MSKKLAAKARLVQLPVLPSRSGAPSSAPSSALPTAPPDAPAAAPTAAGSPTDTDAERPAPAHGAGGLDRARVGSRAGTAGLARSGSQGDGAPVAQAATQAAIQVAVGQPSAGEQAVAPQGLPAQGPAVFGAEDTPVPARPAASARPRTAPGAMAVFMASQSAALKEVDALRAQLQAFDGASPVRPLDPLLVRPSRWANRHEQSFADAAFAALKADIAAAGSNVQPVCVRPLPGVLNGSTPDGAPAYELVFGHRRHRACLELGLPVQAMVMALDDRALFEAMERENRARKNLSAYEQGTMYKRALDDGLYPSQRRLAEALGVDISLVSKSLSLARLPEAVVAAFNSPLDIQFRWAQPLAEALQKDPEGVLARAARLRQRTAGAPALGAAQVLAALVLPARGAADDEAGNPTGHAAQQVIEGKAGRRAVLTRGPRGQLTVAFSPGAIGEAAEAELASFIEKVLGRR